MISGSAVGCWEKGVHLHSLRGAAAPAVGLLPDDRRTEVLRVGQWQLVQRLANDRKTQLGHKTVDSRKEGGKGTASPTHLPRSQQSVSLPSDTGMCDGASSRLHRQTL